VACLKPSRLGMFAADMPSLEGLRHATLAETRKLFIVRSLASADPHAGAPEPVPPIAN
jgi:hypothetical protein